MLIVTGGWIDTTELLVLDKEKWETIEYKHSSSRLIDPRALSLEKGVYVFGKNNSKNV